MWSKLHQWREIIQVICESKIEDGMSPGSKAAYHPYAAWFVLGEVVRRIDGRPFDKYAREEIFLPLGMTDCYVGMDRQAFNRYNAEGRFAELRTMTPKGRIQKNGTVSTQPDEVMACSPGSNGRGPAPQWLLLFEMFMLGGEGRNGTRILKPETVTRMTKRHRIGMYDVVQGILCDWSLGLFVRTGDPTSPQITGKHSTHDTYGHGGSQSSVGFVDPEKRLSVVIVCNTRPGVKHHYERMNDISTAIYEDLGLAKATGPPKPKVAARYPGQPASLTPAPPPPIAGRVGGSGTPVARATPRGGFSQLR
jgi:CubicO group peptidase (beta-lactamase class C family)